MKDNHHFEMSDTSIIFNKSRSGRFVFHRNNLVFTIIPLLFFTFLIFMIAEIHYYYQGWYDPVYAYLLNGLTFALGSSDTGLLTHPGVPLQLFCALLIKILGWIRGTDNLATDVLTNPEAYIRIITIALILLNCTLLWILGLFAFKNLKNRSMAVLMQALPLLSFQLVNFLPVIDSESVITLLSFGIVACILLYDSNKETDQFKLLLIIAILSALSVSTKISSVCILLIPFFFFEKKKSKIIYLSLSVIFIFVFMFPIFDKLGNTVKFIGGIVTHTGKYGLGDEKLFDGLIFLQGLKQMVQKEFSFTMHLLLLPVGWFAIWKRKISGSPKRLYLAITLATIFQVILVARHYSFHYLMPVLTLVMPLHGYFWIRFFRLKISTISKNALPIFVILIVTGIFLRLIILNKFDKSITNPVEKTTLAIKSNWNGKYIILSDYNNGSAFVDPALRFGYAYTGSTMKTNYALILASAYPENYIWNSRDGIINWTSTFIPSDIFSINPQIYIYAKAGKCEISMSKITEMVDQIDMSEFVKLKKVYQNEKSGEVIALAIADTAKIIKESKPRIVIETSMEQLTSDGENIKSNSEEYTFRGGKLISKMFARGGLTSLLLTPSSQFGLDISIPVSKGKRYKVDFWQRSSKQKQVIVVASASKSESFYKTSNQGDNKPGEWTRSELNLSIPADFPEPNINFYLYNTATDSVWIDDFRLMVFE